MSAPAAATNTYDHAVIGAGILGLATARELSRRDPRARIVVLEKEDRIAAHQTGRNSGVIHSGIYYKPGSAKARFCVAGARAMTEYCDERGIPYRRCGKLIVAIRPEEVGALRGLLERADANGLSGVAMLDEAATREVEPHVRGIAAVHVPSAAIVDYGAVSASLADELRAAGAGNPLSPAVRRVVPGASSVRLETDAGHVDAGRLVVCAGLGSDALAAQIVDPARMRIVPFRGDYYRLTPARRGLVRGLIYPVPDARFPFLGVHFTPRMDGEVLLGPNAVLAFGLEAYGRGDFDLGETLATFGFGGFRRLAARYWRTGLAELVRDYSKRRFLDALRAYMPELVEADLLPARSGIRAQAVDAAGGMVDDFWYESVPRVLVVRNAPSPAATASLVLAKDIADRALAA
jgi:L-2-hydroxyglutarate oxidase LhgO